MNADELVVRRGEHLLAHAGAHLHRLVGGRGRIHHRGEERQPVDIDDAADRRIGLGEPQRHHAAEAVPDDDRMVEVVRVDVLRRSDRGPAV